jgi:hypothetical protein
MSRQADHEDVVVQMKPNERQAADKLELHDVLKTRAGRRTLWRVMEYAGMNISSFTGNSTTFFNEGKRDVGLWLRSELWRIDATLVHQMERENTTEMKR